MRKTFRPIVAAGIVLAIAAITFVLLRQQKGLESVALPSNVSNEHEASGEASASDGHRLAPASPQDGSKSGAAGQGGSFPAGTIDGELVLTFSDHAKLRAFLERVRAAGHSPLSVLDGLNAVRMRAEDLAGLGETEAEFDFNYAVVAPTMPEPRQPDGTGYLGFGDGAMKWLGATADTATWGKGIKIALLDTGVEPGSPVASRLAGQIDILGGGAVSGDYTGHGTAIATLLLGEEGRVVGIAPEADVLSVRVIGDDGLGDSFSLAKGILESVDQGARVLSISLGSFGDSKVVENAIAYAQSRGAVVVAAAGNEAVDTVSYPAKYDGVIAVTATDANGVVPYFGNRGAEVDIAAPGVGVVTRWDSRTGIEFTGTSAAVPFVAGTIAGLLSQEPYRPASQVAQLVMDYSNDGGAPGADSVYGSGILNIGRLAQRNVPGVYNLAIADYYVDAARATGSMVPVVISAQNRGTEPLFNVMLEATYSGVRGQQLIGRLEPGQTGSYTVMVPAGRETQVTATARSLVSGTVAAPETRVLKPSTGAP